MGNGEVSIYKVRTKSNVNQVKANTFRLKRRQETMQNEGELFHLHEMCYTGSDVNSPAYLHLDKEEPKSLSLS